MDVNDKEHELRSEAVKVRDRVLLKNKRKKPKNKRTQMKEKKETKPFPPSRLRLVYVSVTFFFSSLRVYVSGVHSKETFRVQTT